MTRQVHSGGCQCGAIRYKISGELGYPHICHCRMCQKASGNFFMALAGSRQEDFLSGCAASRAGSSRRTHAGAASAGIAARRCSSAPRARPKSA